MQKMHDRKNIGKIVLDPAAEPKPKPPTPAKIKVKKEKKEKVNWKIKFLDLGFSIFQSQYLL